MHNNAQPLHCLSIPESHSLFPQTILHCFLQSPNWLYPDPAHRPESETIKNSIYIPAVSTWAPRACGTTHISPHHLCVILNFRPFSIFIWTWPDLKALWTEQRKVLFDHTNNLLLVQRCLLNKYLIQKILALWAGCLLFEFFVGFKLTKKTLLLLHRHQWFKSLGFQKGAWQR